MGKYFKEAFVRDAMVVLGLTIFILTLYLTISFRNRDEELRSKQLDALQHTKLSLENSIKHDLESLKVVRLQIAARPTNASTQSIAILLKKSEPSFTSSNNGFGIPYYLRIGKETLLVSARGRIATPEISLGDVLLKIKNQKPEESFYVDEEAFYQVLKIDQDSYSILKRSREMGDNNIWQSVEDFTEKLGIQNLESYHLWEKPHVIGTIAYGAYISFGSLQSVILLPAQQSYSLTQHLHYEVKSILFIILIGFLFLIYMAFSYNRIVRKTHTHYEKDLNSSRDELLQIQSFAIEEQKERVKNQKVTACLEQLHQTLLELNVRFHQQCVEIREMSKILIQNLTDPEKSFLSLAEQLRLLVDIHQNADCLNYGIIKPNNKANYSLSTIVEQALALCQGEIIKSSISFTVEFEPTTENIFADRTYLIQLLVSLLRKSLERLPKEGWVKLKVELKDLSNKKALQLTIEDNGFMMSPQKIKSFRPKNNMQAFNPLNLPWASIEAMVLHYGGVLDRNELSTGVNRCEVTVVLEGKNEEEVENNVVNLFGSSNAQ